MFYIYICFYYSPQVLGKDISLNLINYINIRKSGFVFKAKRTVEADNFYEQQFIIAESRFFRLLSLKVSENVKQNTQSCLEKISSREWREWCHIEEPHLSVDNLICIFNAQLMVLRKKIQTFCDKYIQLFRTRVCTKLRQLTSSRTQSLRPGSTTSRKSSGWRG